MKACALLILGACITAHAGPPNDSLIKSCLATESINSAVKVTELDSKQYYSDAEYAPDIDGTYLVEYGKTTLGIGRQESDAVVIFDKQSWKLHSATALQKAGSPAEFEPQLAFWGIVETKAIKCLCISFNFPGLGHSGSFQKVRGAYLLPITQKRERLYYAEGRLP